MYYFEKWKEASQHWDKKFFNNWPNFSVKELAQRDPHLKWEAGLTPVLIQPKTLDKLQLLRNKCGFPLRITSAYRTPEYNNSISSTGEFGPHTTGRAFDINVYGAEATLVIYYAHQVGFTGIGSRQTGAYAERFVHIDDLEGHETSGPRPWNWTY